MWNHRLWVVVEAVYIQGHALIGRCIAGILTVRGHHAVESHACQNIVERCQVAVFLNERLYGLACEGIQVGLVRLLVAGAEGEHGGQHA